jgi:sortase A
MLASGKTLHRLSTLCIAAGVFLLLAPAAWVLYTGREASEVQTAALAAWEGGRVAEAEAGSGDHVAGKGGLVLTIPRLGIRRFVPEGATPDHLRRYGVGRITWTALPTDPGILAIAGHRTTYGAPFFRIDRLRPGDTILVDYDRHQYTYRVERQVTVTPDRADTLQDAAVSRGIALVTCSPPYSAALRLVVFGSLDRANLASSVHAPE